MYAFTQRISKKVINIKSICMHCSGECIKLNLHSHRELSKKVILIIKSICMQCLGMYLLSVTINFFSPT